MLEVVLKISRGMAVGLSLFIANGLAGSAPALAADTFTYVHVLQAHNAALRDGLKQVDAHRDGLQSFYENRNYAYFWIEDVERQEMLFSQLESARDHALPVADYRVPELREMINNALTDDQFAEVEIRLSQTFVEFARDLNSGVLVPSEVNREIELRPQVQAAEKILSHPLLERDVEAYVAILAPKDPIYDRLLEEKRRLESIIAGNQWGDAVPANRTLRPGKTANAVVALRARLERMGYGSLGDSKLYDDELMMVVKLVQSRYGLNTDGVAGPGTLGAINTSAQDRLTQVLVNIERQRWTNEDRGDRHIMVNLAAATMAVIDHGEETFVSRVVVGRSRTDFRTPEFSHEMTHLIINPFWHVPKSIAGREYLPMLKEDPLALAKRGLWLMNRRGQRLNTEGADFSGYSEANFPFMIKQPPGGRNALGRVKFMFPNKNNIYLHDTPAKSLFSKDRRAYSHGCVRVARPFDLAYHLLQPQFENPEATFHSHLKRGVERQVDLTKPVPIYLSYNTVWVGADNVPQYRADLYKRDQQVMRALENAGVQRQALEG